ncbi:ORF6N domain-containing protein [Algoriphagus locisalis]|uniref:ORF6N domain-containing protein n=1 Tax=Algoriphagus locisalis TaxID=305507 RepID=A0A1I6YG86_9BACT|nr:ORF6N domain-containing protein [Algoriphagus locisalis]SFT49418.1 ORF6N domain-containing protein [Algoriphagus locisalis]
MTSNDLINTNFENWVFTIRGVSVMIDRDLAEAYHVETKALNQAVKRNIERFPKEFRFQLNNNEKSELVTNCDRLNNLKHSTSLPFAFTEQGVAMISAVLKSHTAVQVSIQLMNAFAEMRKVITNNIRIVQRMDLLELIQIEADQKFEKIFKALENEPPMPSHGIFYDGQIFEAYAFVSTLIKKAQSHILLIDNYIDESVLVLLSKRNPRVKVDCYTHTISPQLELDLKKYNSQFEPLNLHELKKSHDRFLILDGKEMYHFGASIKDLGNKWFAFSKMSSETTQFLIKLGLVQL